jgi:hypothetical protein
VLAQLFLAGAFFTCDAGTTNNILPLKGVPRLITTVDEGSSIEFKCTLPGWSGSLTATCFDDGSSDGAFNITGSCVPGEGSFEE